MVQSIKQYINELRWDFYKRRVYWRGQKNSQNIPTERMESPIDFVVPWVDDSDPKWLQERNIYASQAGISLNDCDNGNERYRDWNIFQYWFRAVEKYAPWVRNVYLVTNGNIPKWINPDAPKLKLVSHAEYIPKDFLPTFSVVPIELNLHRIKGLSEFFVYFNDDMFLGCPVEPEDFFGGKKPNYTALATPLLPDSDSGFYHMLFSTYSIVNNHFKNNLGNTIIKHPERWFAKAYGSQAQINLSLLDTNYISGMVFSHLGVPFKKSTIEKVWENASTQLQQSSSHRFRTSKDLVHQIFSLWEMIDGDFNPVSPNHYGMHFWNPAKQKNEIIESILQQKYRMICINDSDLISKEDHLMLKDELNAAFEKAFPEKSSFEK